MFSAVYVHPCAVQSSRFQGYPILRPKDHCHRPCRRSSSPEAGAGIAHQSFFLTSFTSCGEALSTWRAYRKTRAVCNGHDLGAFAPLSFPHSGPPFFAGENDPSIKASRRSSPPRSRRSSANAQGEYRQIPLLSTTSGASGGTFGMGDTGREDLSRALRSGVSKGFH